MIGSAGEIWINRPAVDGPGPGPFTVGFDDLFAEASKTVRAREDLVEGLDTLQDRLDLDAVIAAQKEVLAAGVERPMADLGSLSLRLHGMLVFQVAADNNSQFDTMMRLVRFQTTEATPRSMTDALRALAKAQSLAERDGEFELLASMVPLAERQEEFRALQTEWEVKRHEVVTVLESAMLSIALAALNNALAEDVAPRMTVKSYDGLRETVTTERIVVTAAYEQLEEMIRVRNEGSFGIAGPRGVGKTTLVRFFANTPGVRTPGEGERERFGVVVSAPVSYVPREFLLHLHAELCRRVLGEPDLLVRRARPAPSASLSGFPGHRAKSVLAAVAAAALTGAAGVLGLALLHRIPWTWHPLATAGVALLFFAVGLLGEMLADGVGGVLITAGGYVRQGRPGLWAIVSATTVAGVTLLYAGGAWPGGSPLILAGVGLLAAGLLAARLTWRIARAERQSREFDARVREAARPRDKLRELASQHLDRIEFQQSVSMERSMALKVGGPLGLDAGGKRGETWQERAQTYPELVADLRTFLLAAGQEYVVVVGVDELDKLRTHEDVEAFLNDIKAVFGTSGCFFLVSVSEDAAAGFERRGVPFRDVFDSAFDDVVSVQHLDLRCARKVLHGLLLGWTEPFVALCYVLSGGLPRDIRRVARELLTYRDETDGIELGAITLAMCRRELDARLRAVRHELMREPSDPAGVELLTRLADLAPATATLADFRGWHDDLDAWTSSEPPSAATRLGAELAALVLLAATVLEFFTPDGCGERVRDAEKPYAGPKNLATLAVARRTLAQSAGISLAYTRRFRTAWEL